MLGRLALLALVVASTPPGPLGPPGPLPPIAGSAPGPTAASPIAPTGAAVVGVHPDPVADGDRGEFVVVSFPPEPGGNWTLSDGETAVALPDPRAGAVAYATAPDAVRALDAPALDGVPVANLSGRLALSNAGERLTLRRDGLVVDAVEYRDAAEGELRRGGAWRPVGATDLAPTEAGAAVTAFALPDRPGIPLATLRSARDRIHLAGYTYTSRRVADALVEAARRGVDVRVLVEGGPVGGVAAREARLLDRLVDAGVTVTVVDGPRARYRFHHAKYAVVDDRLLVTSENWKPGGVGGTSSRGWGVVAANASLAAAADDVFAADSGWHDGIPWRRYRANETFEGDDAVADPEPPGSPFPTRFEARTDGTASVRLLAAPDNAEREIAALVRSADREVLIEQVRIAPGHPFLREAVAAARRGVRVRVLLSGAWYVREDNRALVERLNRRAAREGLPLAARLVEPRSRFEKIHVKGVVVDGERALVGSINWNNVSMRENRELAVVVDSEPVGRHYRRAFLADWHGGAWRLPVGVVAAVALVAAGAAGVVNRRVAFADGADR